jgi:hypothetical protein
MNDHAADRAEKGFSGGAHEDTSPRRKLSAEADMSVEVRLSFVEEEPYPALIEWDMSDNYPTSAVDGDCGPVVGLYNGDEKLTEMRCDARKSTIPWATGIPFIVGLHARIFDWDCQSKSRFLMCKTKPVSKPSEAPTCSITIPVKIGLEEDADGSVVIHHEIDSTYPTSTKKDGTCGPTLALYSKDDVLAKITPPHGIGNWHPIGQKYRSELNARLSDWDCMSMKTFLLCKTDPVP